MVVSSLMDTGHPTLTFLNLNIKFDCHQINKNKRLHFKISREFLCVSRCRCTVVNQVGMITIVSQNPAA